MKHLKEIIAKINNLTAGSERNYIDLLWPYICYSPKMPLRLNQEKLVEEAIVESIAVEDTYFTKKTLQVPVFIWGSGSKTILLTHGWASKGLDFYLLIEELKKDPSLRIITFDAPGNGQADGYLSNLLLYISAVKTIIATYGFPTIAIGHSLGAMANITALAELRLSPEMIISLTPMVNLMANFEASMNQLHIPPTIQQAFFVDFEKTFCMPVDIFQLMKLHTFEEDTPHIILYDEMDKITPFPYLKEFLTDNPSLITINLTGVGHEKIVRSPEANNHMLQHIRQVVQ